jgi:hypothetical protein
LLYKGTDFASSHRSSEQASWMPKLFLTNSISPFEKLYATFYLVPNYKALNSAVFKWVNISFRSRDECR